ncbi:MAG: outer membrane lipoprotein chaperone LolA [Halioglobus sp.]
MTKYLLAAWLGIAPLLSVAQPNSDVNALLVLLEQFKHVQGSFSQRQFAQDKTLLAESSGEFRVLRPSYFAWEVLSPDEQLIIVDPDFIWHYDRDLETVTRRPVTGEAEMVPLKILGGDADKLQEQFHIARQNEDAFVLTPRSEGVGFKQLTLYVDQARLGGMEIEDNLGQFVEITFTDLNVGVDLSSTDFAFTPPPGADLFYYDQ